MADEQMYRVGAYVSDDVGLFEVTGVQNQGPAMPRQRRQVTLESCVGAEPLTLKDLEFDKKFSFVCKRLTDEELYLRYKAIGKEYEAEPRPKPLSYGEELAAKLAAKRENLTCR